MDASYQNENGITIIIVISNNVERQYMKNILQGEGYQTIIADNLRHAREISMSNASPHIVIIDYLVEDPEAYLVRPPNVAFIILLEREEKQMVNALPYEPDDFLYRPLTKTEILYRIKRLQNLFFFYQEKEVEFITPNKKNLEEETATILVVEDNKIERHKMHDFLLSMEYKVLSAADGQEAYHYIQEYTPDLILLDLVLPEIDGIKLLQKIRKRKELLQVPVIIISGLSDTESKLKVLEIGADDFIQKPVNFDELKARMKSVLRKKYHFEKITQDYQMAVERAITDSLTGLYNHGYFYEFIHREINRCRRYQYPLTLIIGDIDHFKNYNDTHGHPKGDAVLKTVGQIIKQNTRIVDMAARYGGEEFGIVLTETDLKGGLIVAEKLRYLIESHPFPGQEAQPGRNLTISMGVSSIPAGEQNTTYSELIDKSDRALYTAKEQGRNQISYLV